MAVLRFEIRGATRLRGHDRPPLLRAFAAAKSGTCWQVNPGLREARGLRSLRRKTTHLAASVGLLPSLVRVDARLLQIFYKTSQETRSHGLP